MFNFPAILVSSLIPLLIGMIWYNPNVFGKAWMSASGLTEEQLKQGSMVKVFGFSLLFSFFLSFLMQMLVIHQSGPLGMIGGPDFIATAKPSYHAFMSDYGDAFRTFKHGLLHGTFSGLFLSLAIVGINGLFEKKSWKYIFIHVGYWVITMGIMGGIICAWK